MNFATCHEYFNRKKCQHGEKFDRLSKEYMTYISVLSSQKDICRCAWNYSAKTYLGFTTFCDTYGLNPFEVHLSNYDYVSCFIFQVSLVAERLVGNLWTPFLRSLTRLHKGSEASFTECGAHVQTSKTTGQCVRRYCWHSACLSRIFQPSRKMIIKLFLKNVTAQTRFAPASNTTTYRANKS